MSNRRSSAIRSELPYAITGTIIGVIAGWSLFQYTQKAQPPTVDPPSIAMLDRR